MKKRVSVLAALAAAAVLAGCAANKPAESAAETTAAAVTETAAETAAEETSEEAASETAEKTDVTVKIGALKGPTTIGIVSMLDQAEKGETLNAYDYTMAVAADELTPKIVSGELDLALLPANAASVLYNKTNGGVTVVDINTLGVLDVVAADDSIKSFADLAGRTVYMTGKGVTPEYAVRYLMQANGLSEDDITLEFKSEPTEVAALLKEDAEAIGILPQPFVTAACAQNENLKIVLDLTKEWDAVQDAEHAGRMITAVTVANTAFLQEHPEAVDAFLADHKASAEFANSEVEATSELVAARGIIEKAPVAKKAIPYCNITCIDGAEMKEALSGYLQVLADQNPAAVGGAVPGEDFYYVKD